MDLAEFLLARIADDEAAARESASVLLIIRTDRCAVIGSDEHRTYMHFDRHNPARVLAECDAKRALVTELQRMLDEEVGWDNVEYKVMGYLALPYADHDDYRPEWAPTVAV